jgi:hypothetical protein
VEAKHLERGYPYHPIRLMRTQDDVGDSFLVGTYLCVCPGLLSADQGRHIVQPQTTCLVIDTWFDPPEAASGGSKGIAITIGFLIMH